RAEATRAGGASSSRQGLRRTFRSACLQSPDIKVDEGSPLGARLGVLRDVLFPPRLDGTHLAVGHDSVSGANLFGVLRTRLKGGGHLGMLLDRELSPGGAILRQASLEECAKT